VTPNPETILAAADVLRQIIKPLVDRIEVLETRLDAVEGREDAGVWQPGRTYPKFAGVTWNGSWWIAQARTSEQPGEGATAWRMAVRRGKQGKQGPPGPPCECSKRMAS
jgi:hypothetical protein